MSKRQRRGHGVTVRNLDEIRENPLFATTGAASFATLTRGAYVQNFPPHTELISEGELPDFLHVVTSGLVELFASWGGHETSMSFLGPNATFILAATIRDRPYLMSARTLEKSRIIMIPSDDVRAAFEADSDFAKAIVAELAICYRQSVKTAKNLKLRSSRERLANYILQQHRESGEPGKVELKVEKKKLAAFLGMTPENLSRSFVSLAVHGLQVDGQTVRITNAGALRRFARPNPLIDS